MFADKALATRIEIAGTKILRDSAFALKTSTPESTAFEFAIGEGSAVFLRPGSPLNKITGIGLREAIDVSALAEAEALFRARGEPARVELATLSDFDAGRHLTERGYRLLGFENVLARSLPAGAPQSTDIEITRVEAEKRELWMSVLIDGFSCPDATGVVIDQLPRDLIEVAIRDTVYLRACERYLALRDGQPAGAASLQIEDGIAFFTGAATLSDHRRHGIQAALLAKRLHDAQAMGADLAVITTGGGTRSQANAMRQGFSLIYSRAILELQT